MPELTDPKTMHLLSISGMARERSEQFLAAYVNHTEATSSFYDCRIIFSQITKNLSGELFIEELVAVDMTWEHAAKVRDMLDGVVKSYEAQNGKVRVLEEIHIPQPK
jgi:hypothetical protein